MHLSEEFKRTHGLTKNDIADTMAAFYARVDKAAAELEQSLKNNHTPLKCRPGCCACCMDGLTATPAEAAVIEKQFPSLNTDLLHEPGACPFLTPDGLCQIYAARPFICRTHGLPLKWFDDASDSPDEIDSCDTELHQSRSICPINDDAIDILALPDELCWNPQTAETQLAIMNEAVFPDEERIKLRDLCKRLIASLHSSNINKL